jgi:hypothetical protein
MIDKKAKSELKEDISLSFHKFLEKVGVLPEEKKVKFVDSIFRKESLLSVSDGVGALVDIYNFSLRHGFLKDRELNILKNKLRSVVREKLIVTDIENSLKEFDSPYPFTFAAGIYLQSLSGVAEVLKEDGEIYEDLKKQSLKILEKIRKCRGDEDFPFWSWALVENWKDEIGKADLYATECIVTGIGSFLPAFNHQERELKRLIKGIAEELLKWASSERKGGRGPCWREWIDSGRKRPLDHFSALSIVMTALETGALKLRDIGLAGKFFVELLSFLQEDSSHPFNYFTYHRYLSRKYSAIFIEEGVTPFYHLNILLRLYNFFPKFFKDSRRERLPLLAQELLEHMEIFLDRFIVRSMVDALYRLIRKVRNNDGLWDKESFVIYLTRMGFLCLGRLFEELENEDSFLMKINREEYGKLEVIRTAMEILQSPEFSKEFAYQLYLGIRSRRPSLFIDF